MDVGWIVILNIGHCPGESRTRIYAVKLRALSDGLQPPHCDKASGTEVRNLEDTGFVDDPKTRLSRHVVWMYLMKNEPELHLVSRKVKNGPALHLAPGNMKDEPAIQLLPWKMNVVLLEVASAHFAQWSMGPCYSAGRTTEFIPTLFDRSLLG